MKKVSLKNQCKVTTISINNLTLDTVDIPDVITKDFAKWYKSDKSRPTDYYQEVKLSFDAGNPTISKSELKKIFSEAREMDHELALFNPMLEVEIAAACVQNRHKQKLRDLFADIKSASVSELREKYQELSEDDELVGFLAYLQDSLYDGDTEWDWENAANTFLLESYAILSEGTKEKKSVLKDYFPETYRFVTSLIQNNIAQPYLFWTLSDDAEDYFNRCAFEICHDSRVLAVKGSLSDPRAEFGVVYPTEFKPLAEVDQDFVYNIESTQFALTNKLIETSDLNQIGFEVGAGMGDGYYPTIPFFDHLGELQMVTTYFTHMVDSEHLDFGLENTASNGILHFQQVPLEMGYLDCDGSFFFGDSTWFHNGPGDDLIIEFSDLPVDKYLVVRFIDVDGENRTWAVSVMRDKAKRNFEILFKVFPELTNRNDDF
jgi:hypothetical protein